MLTDSLMALASLAGQTVVTAAVTDTWEAARRKFAQLLGRGDSNKTKLADQRLTETHDQLARAAGTDLERTRTALAERWAGRLADLLEEDPDMEPDLRVLLQEIQAVLPADMMSAVGHVIVAGQDVNITASGGGIAAGMIHGNVALPNPPSPSPAER